MHNTLEFLKSLKFFNLFHTIFINYDKSGLELASDFIKCVSLRAGKC